MFPLLQLSELCSPHLNNYSCELRYSDTTNIWRKTFKSSKPKTTTCLQWKDWDKHTINMMKQLVCNNIFWLFKKSSFNLPKIVLLIYLYIFFSLGWRKKFQIQPPASERITSILIYHLIIIIFVRWLFSSSILLYLP